MKNNLMRAALACLIVSVVGCGPEIVAVAAVTAQVAPVVGAVAGTVWLCKSIENVSLDNDKKRLEVQALSDGVRGSYKVDLTEEQYRQVRDTGMFRIGDTDYRVY